PRRPPGFGATSLFWQNGPEGRAGCVGSTRPICRKLRTRLRLPAVYISLGAPQGVRGRTGGRDPEGYVARRARDRTGGSRRSSGGSSGQGGGRGPVGAGPSAPVGGGGGGLCGGGVPRSRASLRHGVLG